MLKNRELRILGSSCHADQVQNTTCNKFIVERKRRGSFWFSFFQNSLHELVYVWFVKDFTSMFVTAWWTHWKSRNFRECKREMIEEGEKKKYRGCSNCIDREISVQTHIYLYMERTAERKEKIAEKREREREIGVEKFKGGGSLPGNSTLRAGCIQHPSLAVCGSLALSLSSSRALNMKTTLLRGWFQHGPDLRVDFHAVVILRLKSDSNVLSHQEKSLQIYFYPKCKQIRDDGHKIIRSPMGWGWEMMYRKFSTKFPINLKRFVLFIPLFQGQKQI